MNRRLFPVGILVRTSSDNRENDSPKLNATQPPYSHPSCPQTQGPDILLSDHLIGLAAHGSWHSSLVSSLASQRRATAR